MREQESPASGMRSGEHRDHIVDLGHPVRSTECAGAGHRVLDLRLQPKAGQRADDVIPHVVHRG
jgi:hypothetical protein